MSKGKKNKRQYLVLDYTVFREQGWTRDDIDFVLDRLLDIIEGFKGQCSGISVALTEEEMEERFVKEEEEE